MSLQRRLRPALHLQPKGTMRPTTARKVADVLLGVEMLLGYGRPRKLPSQEKRPLAETFSGTKIHRLTKKHTPAMLAKISLPGAFALSMREYGYTNSIRKQAEEVFLDRLVGWVARDDPRTWSRDAVEHYDTVEPDTRLLTRVARQSRLDLERQFNL